MNWLGPVAPCKISDRGVKGIIRRVVQEPRNTCGELQKELESAGTCLQENYNLCTVTNNLMNICCLISLDVIGLDELLLTCGESLISIVPLRNTST